MSDLLPLTSDRYIFPYTLLIISQSPAINKCFFHFTANFCNRFLFSEYTAFRRAGSAAERGEFYALRKQTKKAGKREYPLHTGGDSVSRCAYLSCGLFSEVHTAVRRRCADRAGDLSFKAIAILSER